MHAGSQRQRVGAEAQPGRGSWTPRASRREVSPAAGYAAHAMPDRKPKPWESAGPLFFGSRAPRPRCGRPGGPFQLRWRLKSRATWRTRILSRFRSTISTAKA